jgi:hypothetical protein
VKREPLDLRRLIAVITALALAMFGPTSFADDGLPIWPGVNIWPSDRYCAFTDLARFDNRFYCTFREGTAHVHGEDGKIRIIASDDGDTWRSVALLAEEGVDLRDPKLSITPDDRLMVSIGGSFYKGGKRIKAESRVAFSDPAGQTFSDPQPVRIDPTIRTEHDWLWRVTWHNGTAYGVVYQPRKTGDETTAHLVSSRDGITYDLVTTFDIDGRPNEATLRFMPDGELIALVRREAGNRSAVVGSSRPPYIEWTWHEIGHRLGGPDFIRLPDGRLLAGSRAYATDPQGKDQYSTTLASLTKAGDYKPLLRLESAGDTSYPGLLLHDNQLWVSYYSSHESRAAIYLARIPLTELPASDN